MFDQCVARSELGYPGHFFDPENRWTGEHAAGCSQLRKEANTSLKSWFAGALRQNEVDPEPLGYAIAHCLQSTLRLFRFARIEC